MGITALAAFASEISGGNLMSCTISYGSGQSANKDNSLVLQSVEVFSVGWPHLLHLSHWESFSVL